MFEMSAAHVSAFQQMVSSIFEERIIRHLRENLHRYTEMFSDDELRLRIRVCVQAGRRYNLSTERQSTCFIDTSFILGPDFERDPDFPEARQILQCDDTADERASALLDYAIEVAQDSEAING